MEHQQLNPEVWGPPFWFTLHTAALCYPHHPTEATKRKYYELFLNMPLFLPHPEIQKRWVEWMDRYPVTPYLKTRESLCRWVHFIHNRVNTLLGKKEPGFWEGLDLYAENYKPKPAIAWSERWNIRHGTLVVVFVLVALWLAFCKA